MNLKQRSHEHICIYRPGFLASAFALSMFAALVAGCGSSSSSSNSPSSGPIPGESTAVAIQLSSTANDQFIRFGMQIEGISITNKAGVTTTIFNTPTAVDFIPVNGNSMPLATVSVPQDVYTSAAVTVTGPAFSYTFANDQGGITFSTDAYGYTPTPPVVTLASPITISGSAMGLTLNLLATQSGSVTGFPNQTAYSINPTFTLSAFTLPAKTTTPQNGKCIGLIGQVTAINTAGDSMTVTLPGNRMTGNPSLKVALDSATVFQGIVSASGLNDRTLVEMDVSLQPDVSYSATRVEVPDPAATNVATGQLAVVDPSYGGYFITTATLQSGVDLSVQPIGMGAPYMFTDSTRFQTSARFTNLGKLPFTATFSGATLAAGQMVSVDSTVMSLRYPYTSPTSMTLVPQIIDATINAVTTSGSYSVYTVQLAPYDLIVQMNSPTLLGADVHLPDPSVVNVYVDSNTSLLNSTTLGTNRTFRFEGLLFNDGGILRMVCDKVSDGVPL